MTSGRSVNFTFLATHDPVLVDYAAEAEAVFREHPRLSNLRTLAERSPSMLDELHGAVWERAE